MIQELVSARRYSAGGIQTALASPLGTEDRPRAVGPFVVVAHVLPFEVAPGALPPDFDVRPHPHNGLAAISYVLAGHVTHRDSLGSRQEVGPGGFNFMIAGSGVVHSERFERLRVLGGKFEMFQMLLALPEEEQEADPGFQHVEAARVEKRVAEGAVIRVLADTEAAETAVSFPAPMFLHDVHLEPTGRYVPSHQSRERAVYVLEGAVEVGGTRVEAQQTALLASGPTVVVSAGPARLLAFGGEPVGPRYMWWNFMHSSLERIEAAKTAWREGRMTLPPGDTESFTPAPPDEGRPLRRINA